MDDRSIPPGEVIARLFEEEAGRRLSSAQMQQTANFLRDPFRGNEWHRPTLQRNLNERLEDFYAREVAISGEPQDRLTRPEGQPDAALDLILHVQSGHDAIDKFYDPRSATINLLEEKGITENLAFGYDWHWRAQGQIKRGQGCPAPKWSKELRALHDGMSRAVLETLPLPIPLINTASACIRGNIKKYLPIDVVSFNLDLIPPLGILQFDLDFRFGYLKRIILHLHHPAAAFFTGKANRVAMGYQLDTSINLFLGKMIKKVMQNPKAILSLDLMIVIALAGKIQRRSGYVYEAVNSIVDFLEGKTKAWTEKQPRRFLNRAPVKGRENRGYTFE